jgi:hypothetical protein
MRSHWVHGRTFLLSAFVLSIVLGAVVALRHPGEPHVAPAALHADLAESVRATPEYREAETARAKGQPARAADILTRLSRSPILTEAQRGFCRREIDALRR